MQDLSQYKKKETIEINARYVSPLIAGLITLVGLVFAMGVLVGNSSKNSDKICPQTDTLAKLNDQSKEPAVPKKIDETSFYQRLAQESARIPLPASLKSFKGGAKPLINDATEKEELKNVALIEPKTEEDPVPEKIRDSEADIFTLQVGSFQDRREASLMVSRLKKAGHKSFLVRVHMPDQGGEWFRVRVGPFTSKRDAWAYKAEFESKERLPAFVVKRRG